MTRTQNGIFVTLIQAKRKASDWDSSYLLYEIRSTGGGRTRWRETHFLLPRTAFNPKYTSSTSMGFYINEQWPFLGALNSI